ncbi:16418_t:CDS:2, partial [Funneliformis caledonium]
NPDPVEPEDVNHHQFPPVRRLMTDTKLGGLPLRVESSPPEGKTALRRSPSLMTGMISPLRTSRHHPPSLMTGMDEWVK